MKRGMTPEEADDHWTEFGDTPRSVTSDNECDDDSPQNDPGTPEKANDASSPVHDPETDAEEGLDR